MRSIERLKLLPRLQHLQMLTKIKQIQVLRSQQERQLTQKIDNLSCTSGLLRRRRRFMISLQGPSHVNLSGMNCPTASTSETAGTSCGYGLSYSGTCPACSSGRKPTTLSAPKTSREKISWSGTLNGPRNSLPAQRMSLILCPWPTSCRRSTWLSWRHLAIWRIKRARWTSGSWSQLLAHAVVVSAL